MVGDNELLSDAHLKLMEGQHYGLVGRNGVGKSSLLKAIGYGLVTGFPSSIRCLYVDQLEGVDSQQTPVDIVVAADVEAQRAEHEAQQLQEALESSDVVAMATALRGLRLQRLQNDVTAAYKIAEKRSGERGLAARQALVAAEARLADAQQQLSALVTPEELGAAAQAAQDELTVLFDRLALRSPEEAEAQARSILTGLGFSKEQQDAPLGQLSGGWRIRVSLAQALFLKPDVLLLDEPTNHLDLRAIVWLQRYLSRLEDTTVVVVSHDRAFLNAVAQEIIVFRDRRLAYWAGNYDEYVQQREDKQAHQARLAEGVQRKKEHMERSIQEGLKQARQQGDDKKLGMVASRKKKLENRMGVEKNAAGHRLKVNKDFVGYFDAARQQAEVEAPEALPVWKVPEVQPLRQKGALVQVEGLACGYKKGKPVLKEVSFSIEQDDRLALVGPNGEGKSTLVKTLLGDLPPLAGTVQTQSAARVAYFQQGQVEELCQRAGVTALSYMQERWASVREQELRNQLGSFGIKGSLATQPLSSLSGGQAVRVALAAVFFASPHLMVLDEPSNHLDLEGVECLAAALQSYTGAMVLVSHDQFLIKEVAQRVFLVADGEIAYLERGVEEYAQQLASGKRVKKAAVPRSTPGGSKDPAAAAKGGLGAPGAGRNIAATPVISKGALAAAKAAARAGRR
ncbi:hypothetical protein N2152v2_003994 [Parachlorella kessleri]